MTERGWKPAEHQIKGYVKMGFGKLKEWFGAEWHEIKHIKNMRSLLRISESNPTVKYPALNEKSEGCITGYTYEQLSDTSLLPHDKRVACLQTPWTPWNIFKKENIYSTTEKNDKRGSGKERSKETYKKPKSSPLPKSMGKMKKWLSKDCGMLATDDGKEVSVNLSNIKGGKAPKEGQRVMFHIVQGNVPQAKDVEIVQ